MSNIDKQALRGLSVESPFYLAECCNCGEIMPSSKLRESRNYPDDDGECHCPHCNADDCDIADSGAVGSEGVTAWNYQQKRIEALLDELEAAEERYEDMLRQARSFREAHDSASEIIRQLERNKLVVKLPTTKLWAGKVACYEASEIIELLFSAGIRIQGED
ncbi:ead/Ea22-like family protein [Enterobacter ludwigii]|jgi:hypothetical protein|uniref:ead/Ea22-like family protein n=1 Tax=Enterobacter ludwigii TaxID=299767 RepID=UPI001868E85D|nr:ead/Ea22-like family protein [Enterobacter ludwigii]